MSDADSSEPIPPAERVAPEADGAEPGKAPGQKSSAGPGLWEAPTAEELGRLLPQYRIESLIGRGGMGAVYKGVQLTLDRVVAIKLLPVEVAADTQFVTRFEREARTLARLHHACIVTIHDFGRTSAGHLYFVMEYIDGTNLREILHGPGLDPEQALVVVGQLCEALQAAHREGIVHRDIKPENVLITGDGDVKLADFGLARPPQEAGTSALTNTNIVMGTPDYMAPEQRFDSAKADHRADIFALGVMFYEMLTGQTPRGVFAPPSHKAQVDVRIDDVVLKALQSEPDRRYQQVSEMRTDVERIRTTPLPAPGPAQPPRSGALSPRSKALLVGAAGVVTLLGAGGYFLWFKGAHRAPPDHRGGSVAVAPTPASHPGAGTAPPKPQTPASAQASTGKPQDRAPSLPVRTSSTPIIRADAAKSAPPAKTNASFSSRGAAYYWQDRLTDKSLWPAANGWHREGAAVTDLNEFGVCAFPESMTDAAIRIRFRCGSEASFINLFLRGSQARETGARYVAATFLDLNSHADVRVAATDTGPLRDLAWVGGLARINAGDEHTIEFYVQGPRLSYYFDGQLRAEPRDGTHAKGRFGIACGRQIHLLKVETAVLPSLPTPSSTLAAGPASGGNVPNLAKSSSSGAVTVSAPMPASPPVAPPKDIGDAVMNYVWSWEDLKGEKPPITIQFLSNGLVAGGGWGWGWFPEKKNGRVIVDCFWGGPRSGEHMYLDFDEQFAGFVASGGKGAKGRRLQRVGEPSAAPPVAPTVVKRDETPKSQPTPPPVPVVPPARETAASPLPSKSEQSMIEVLSDQAPNVTNWITAPLDRDVPGEIWQNMTFLKEALRDEAVKSPSASTAAYGMAVRLCFTMVAYLEERRAAETLSGGDAVLHQKSNLTEWRRDHLTWPMYALEADERAERQKKGKNTKVFMKDLKIQQWANRSREMRAVIDTQYSQFREALRQSPVRK